MTLKYTNEEMIDIGYCQGYGLESCRVYSKRQFVAYQTKKPRRHLKGLREKVRLRLIMVAHIWLGLNRFRKKSK